MRFGSSFTDCGGLRAGIGFEAGLRAGIGFDRGLGEGMGRRLY